MQTDRERIEVLERTVRLLAETTRDALIAVRSHMHEGSFEPPDHQLTGKVDRALGHLGAVLSGLGVGQGGADVGRGAEGGGRDEGGTDE